MKVTKQGELPDDEIWTGTCHYCESEVEAARKELTIVDDQREGPFGKARCPVCAREMFFYRRKPWP